MLKVGETLLEGKRNAVVFLEVSEQLICGCRGKRLIPFLHFQQQNPRRVGGELIDRMGKANA